MSEFQLLHDDSGYAPDGLECSHCGHTAVSMDEDGNYDSGAYLCEECEIEGIIVHHPGNGYDELAWIEWVPNPGARCERDVCDTCEVP